MHMTCHPCENAKVSQQPLEQPHESILKSCLYCCIVFRLAAKIGGECNIRREINETLCYEYMGMGARRRETFASTFPVAVMSISAKYQRVGRDAAAAMKMIAIVSRSNSGS